MYYIFLDVVLVVFSYPRRKASFKFWTSDLVKYVGLNTLHVLCCGIIVIY